MAMNTGMNKYRSMMRRMEQGMGEENIPAPMNMGMDSMRNLDRMGGEAIPARQDMGMDSMSRDDAMRRVLDPRSVVRAEEMGKNLSMLEQEMAGLSMSDKEAIEALTSMGISLEDAMKAVLDPQSFAREDTPSVIREGEMGETMGPALGALPMPRPATRSVTREGEMGADRTQDMDMQKFNMGTQANKWQNNHNLFHLKT